MGAKIGVMICKKLRIFWMWHPFPQSLPQVPKRVTSSWRFAKLIVFCFAAMSDNNNPKGLQYREPRKVIATLCQSQLLYSFLVFDWSTLNMLLPCFWCMIEPITKNLGGIACYMFLFQLVGYNLQLQPRWEICWVDSPSVSYWVVSLHVWRPRKRFPVHPCRWTNLILPSNGNKWFVALQDPGPGESPATNLFQVFSTDV